MYKTLQLLLTFQLEYSYPPLCDGKEVDSHDLPEEWKHLPSLALPDGAHNYDKGRRSSKVCCNLQKVDTSRLSIPKYHLNVGLRCFQIV
jgi:hypothetical protein